MKPLITIGITAYHVGPYLKECWNSVVKQTDPRWEAIMVLDGDNDDHTIEEFQKINHTNLKKYSFKKNGGPYLGRTFAIENSNTSWYCQLDGDDILPEDTVELLIKEIEKNKSIDFIYGHTHFFEKFIDDGTTHKADNINPEQLVFSPMFNAASPISKKLFNKLGGYCSKLNSINADWDFWIGAEEIDALGAKIDRTIYYRRVRNDNVGNKFFYKRAEIVEIIINRHPKYFDSQEKIEKCKGKVYEMIAREYRKRNERKNAKLFAEKALNHICNKKTMLEIIKESKMIYLKYILRRWLRKIAA